MSAFDAILDYHYSTPERPKWGAANRAKSDAMAQRFKIERGVPIPKARANNGAKIRGISGVMRKLKKGDSVYLPVNHGYASAAASRHIGAGCYQTRREGAGVRVWRTK